MVTCYVLLQIFYDTQSLLFFRSIKQTFAVELQFYTSTCLLYWKRWLFVLELDKKNLALR